jgi:hypothetical protein
VNLRAKLKKSQSDKGVFGLGSCSHLQSRSGQPHNSLKMEPRQAFMASETSPTLVLWRYSTGYLMQGLRRYWLLNTGLTGLPNDRASGGESMISHLSFAP